MKKEYTSKKYMTILNKEDINIIKKFGDTYYPIIHKLYYKTLWNALTIEQRKEILGEDYIHEIYGKYD